MSNRFELLASDYPATPTHATVATHSHHLHGSPQSTPTDALGEDLVHVGHRIELTDTTFITPVRRHYPLHDLEKLPAALELQKHVDGKIVVSPAKSATDDMEVRVETSMESLLKKME
jgi:hypothetical protein